MSAGVSVAATGSALAFLLFENENSRNNQAGFLLGDVVLEKKKLISDSDYGQEKTETVVHVHAVLQDETLSSSYTLNDNNYLKSDAFGKIKNSIVGWYSFRRNVSAIPTLKDRFIHKQLLELFSAKKECFLFCLLTSSENIDNKSHSFRQHFMVHNASIGKYEAVPLLIENLANVSPLYRAPLPPTGEKLLQNLINPTWNHQNLVDHLQEKLASELVCAIFQLGESERIVSETEQTLTKLRKERDELRVFENAYGFTDSPKGDGESNVTRERTRESKRAVDESGDCGDTNQNRYQNVLQPQFGLRGVLASPPPSNLRAEAPPFSPRTFYRQ